MEYSIQALSRLSGVTTRTLRWYDQIGLLKPARVAETGYRYYGPAEVDRLRDILYYRALGVELARIRECLDDPLLRPADRPARSPGWPAGEAVAAGQSHPLGAGRHPM
ncbi:MAG: MerR family transcriptional regulator [Candidatus Limiplasma sp.]|nr:MerR family transcriptional regulator [Candidatus Limiplasma sp.]